MKRNLRINGSKAVFLLAVVIMSMFSFVNVFGDDGYGYIGDQVVKEIYEVYDSLEVLESVYLPQNDWDNPELEKQCLKNLNDFYGDEKNAPAKVKAVKIYFEYPQWKNYTRVSSDENDGAPTYRKSLCSYVLQKDKDKFILVVGREIVEDCTNYNRATLKPISYSDPRVATLNATDWEEWGKATAFKLTPEQAADLGLVAGKKAKNIDVSKRTISLEYQPGTDLNAKIMGKSKTNYVIMWEGGDIEFCNYDKFGKTKPNLPSADNLKVGTKVSAQWTNGSYYNGKIKEINGSKYTIEWDDGDTPIDVTINQIRLRE